MDAAASVRVTHTRAPCMQRMLLFSVGMLGRCIPARLVGSVAVEFGRRAHGSRKKKCSEFFACAQRPDKASRGYSYVRAMLPRPGLPARSVLACAQAASVATSTFCAYARERGSKRTSHALAAQSRQRIISVSTEFCHVQTCHRVPI